jgi:hypothetical protein
MPVRRMRGMTREQIVRALREIIARIDEDELADKIREAGGLHRDPESGSWVRGAVNDETPFGIAC